MIKLKNLLNEGGNRQYGFDLTDIKAKHWINILKSVGLNPNSGKASNDGWKWSNDKITIVTANNPITGEYYAPNRRAPEKDYASYIGLEGDEETVLSVAKMIKKYADGIKDENPRNRDYI